MLDLGLSAPVFLGLPGLEHKGLGPIELFQRKEDPFSFVKR